MRTSVGVLTAKRLVILALLPLSAAVRLPLGVRRSVNRRERAHHPRCSDDDEVLSTPIQLVSMQCPSAVSAEFWSELLLEYGALYVSMSDGDRDTPKEVPLYQAHPPGSSTPTLIQVDDAGEPLTWTEYLDARHIWSNATLEVGFGGGVNVESVLLDAAATAETDTLPRFTIEALVARDWVSEVQSNWPPVLISESLFIRFPWHTEEAPDGIPMLTLQPGMAFGTGEHATTQLCCEELKKRFDGGVYDGTTLLDYGSGSGVLAFAALLYGASDAVGVEIDAEALRISRINAAANGMQDRFEARSCGEEGALDTKYPLVVANILAGTLAQLEPTLAAKTQPGGELVLSGIWGEGQANTVKEAYTAHFENFSERVEDGWYVISATRRGV